MVGIIAEQVWLFMWCCLLSRNWPHGPGVQNSRRGLQLTAGVSEGRWWNWFSKCWKNCIQPLLKRLPLLGWRSSGMMQTRRQEGVSPAPPLAPLIGGASRPSSWQTNTVCRSQPWHCRAEKWGLPLQDSSFWHTLFQTRFIAIYILVFTI